MVSNEKRASLAAYPADLHDLEEEWSALWDRCADATPFAAPEWLRPWSEHLFGGGEIWTVAVRYRDRLVGLAPLFVYGYPHEPRKVSLIGAGVTDYLDFLLEPELAVEAVETIWEHLRDCSGRWDVCDFPDIPQGSPLLEYRFPSGWDVERSASEVCPVVNLPGAMEEFEARLTPKFRHNLRNSRNRLMDLAGAEFETGCAEQDPEYVEALFRLHADRWKHRHERGVLSTSPLQAFFRDVVASFRRRGWLRFHGFRFEGKLAAVMCVFVARARAYYYLGGFDDSLARYSPGTALLGYAIERAIREGASEFDFLRKPELYKYRWGAADRKNFRLVITRAPETSSTRR